MLRWYPGNGKSVPPRSTFARSDPLPPVSPAPAIGALIFDVAPSGVTVASFASVFGRVLDVCGAGLVDNSGRSAARGAGTSGTTGGVGVTTPTERAPAWVLTM